MDFLSQLFLSEVRAALFRLFLGPSAGRMYRAEIIARFKFAGRSVEEELEKLVRLELLHTTKDGNRRYYEVNRAHPLYPELRGIVLKTGGLREVIAEALKGLKVEQAFVFGSIAAGTETAASDVDLMVIGDATHRQAASGLRRASEVLAREINPHFFSTGDFFGRLANRDHFLSDVMAKPKLFIVGDNHEFTNMAQRRLAATPPDKS
ncbi:MAG TPA: nucleotidyltransferase domain-containing protein [Rariglobus sp.]